MKLVLFSLLLSFILISIPLVYAQEFFIEFSENSKFVKGEFVGVLINGVDFDSSSVATGIILDNTGNSIDIFEFDIGRYVDVDDQGWARIETDNPNYQVDVLYTVRATYQGVEKQLQFTLAEPPLTLEELTESQQEVSSEFEVLRTENKELREEISILTQQIKELNERIGDLLEIIQEQINVMMTTLANLTN